VSAKTRKPSPEEDKKTKEVMKEALGEQKFFKQFAEAYFVVNVTAKTFAGEWKSEDNQQFTLTFNAGEVSATWTHGKKKYELSGKSLNRGAKITLKVMPESDDSVISRYLSATSTKESTGYAYISADGQKMYWMLSKDKETSFQSFSQFS
jgi:hypothetical protein